ncbi:MAG: TonB-dependent siderophore receptor [Acidobacteria bacterium]|nr:TonB-dependent siderophore receptor [Acidobacteriota bacterium]
MAKRTSKTRRTRQRTGQEVPAPRSKWLRVSALAASAAVSFRLGTGDAWAQDLQHEAADRDRIGLALEALWPGHGFDAETPTLTALLDRKRPDGDLYEPARKDPPLVRFDIPPGPLGSCLEAFRKISGIEAEVSDPVIAEIHSAGVSGRLGVRQALGQLLLGTGVTYRFTAPETVRLEVSLSETVEVTAAPGLPSPKYTEPLKDIPQSVTVIPQQLIEEQGATTLRDTLRNVTGISIQAGEGGVPAGDNLSIRGFNARTDLFIDGVRDVGGYSRDSFNLEQVEVVKGPASVYAGRGATGGSVNLVSKTPRLDAFGDATLGVGTDRYSRTTVDVNQPLEGLADGAAFRINAMFTNADTPARDQVTNRRWGVAPSVSFGLGTPTRFNLSYSHLAQDNLPDYGIPWVPDNNVPLADLANQPAPVDFENFYGLVDRDYEKTSTGIATATLTHDFDNSMSLRTLVRYGSTDRDSIITAPRFSSTGSTDIRRTDTKSRDQRDSILVNQTDLTADFRTGGVQHRLVAGVELGLETMVNFDRAEIGPTPPDTDLYDPNPFDPYQDTIVRTGDRTDVEAKSAALYAFDTIELGERWQVVGGLRWDRFDVDYADEDGPISRLDEAVSWRAGAVFHPTPQGSIYAGVGTSFNPSAEDLRLRSTTFEVDPESSTSYELGTKWDFQGSRLSLAAAVFRTDKTNARTPGLDPDDPPTVLEGKQRVSGAEISVSGQITRRWTGTFGYSYMESEILESNDPREVGQPFGNTPDHSLSLWTTYRLRHGLEIGGGVQYVGDRYNNNRGQRVAPAYTLYDAVLSYDVNQRLTFRLNGNNLTDERYIDRVGGGHFIPGPGRSLALTTSLSF